MTVDLKNGACRSSGGQLEITEADDATMTAICQECCDSYAVETDTFNDGGIDYYPGVLAQPLKNGKK